MGLATTHYVGLPYPSIGVVRGEPVMVGTDRWDWGVDLAGYSGLVLAVEFDHFRWKTLKICSEQCRHLACQSSQT
jgi:hypothetical protein